MPQNGETTAEERYYDRCKHRNNQCLYNYLILENYIKITKIRIME